MRLGLIYVRNKGQMSNRIQILVNLTHIFQSNRKALPVEWDTVLDDCAP